MSDSALRDAVQAMAGLSYVNSVTELSDIAGTGSLAWYAPHNLMLEVGGRYNISRPGDITSHRLSSSGHVDPILAAQLFAARYRRIGRVANGTKRHPAHTLSLA